MKSQIKANNNLKKIVSILPTFLSDELLMKQEDDERNKELINLINVKEEGFSTQPTSSSSSNVGVDRRKLCLFCPNSKLKFPFPIFSPSLIVSDRYLVQPNEEKQKTTQTTGPDESTDIIQQSYHYFQKIQGHFYIPLPPIIKIQKTQILTTFQHQSQQKEEEEKEKTNIDDQNSNQISSKTTEDSSITNPPLNSRPVINRDILTSIVLLHYSKYHEIEPNSMTGFDQHLFLTISFFPLHIIYN